MATAQALKVSREKINELFLALGYKIAHKWPPKRMLARIQSLDTMVTDDTAEEKGLDKAQTKLLNDLLEAAKEKTNIVIEEKGASSAKGGKNGAKGSKTQEDPDSEEEEGEDEDSETEEEDEEDDDSEEDEEEEEKPKAKKASVKPKAGKDKPKAAPAKKVGVIATIIDLLKKATSKKPISKDGITAKLAEKFPDRDEKAMKSTVASQVPSGLKAEKGIKCESNDKGFWVVDSKGY